MTRWWAVAGLAGGVLLAVLVLSRLSSRAITTGTTPSDTDPRPAFDDDTGPEWVPDDIAATSRPNAQPLHRGRPRGQPSTNLDQPEAEPPTVAPGGVDAGLSTAWLLANVAFTQGLFLTVLAGGLVVLSVPPSVLGTAAAPADLAAGVGLGVGLYVASQLGAAVADRAGLGHDERLRELLAPASPTGWTALLGLVLPVIAVFEELLFRGVLIGVLAAGFPVSPWLLAAGSSVAFGLGHGAQGRTGVLVTGTLGFVLAAGYVITGSLAAVILAHYLVNALEFVVHEGLGLEWADSMAG